MGQRTNIGEAIRYNAKSVIVATGGFCRNHEMISEYMPDFASISTEVGVGSTDGWVVRMWKCKSPGVDTAV